ncbi:hypothetical protein TEA_026179 [Camellia sinensis var. sinensis]|uniref:PsbP C-terminal domain-containing protein n=1 Tax=Camellia sinensis var. sinensis TaxID=542762 RepID=A0A4S4EZ79_CAMSN|nr:hypothetical protein TEA_026179 [Camellia sinensis var. sinensis]
MLSLSIVALVFASSPITTSISIAMAEDLQLQRYTDSKEGATVLFEEPNKGANNVGVVVNPVRLTKLEEFGSPQFVADKLVQAERRKSREDTLEFRPLSKTKINYVESSFTVESTKDAEVIAVSERSGKGGLRVYEFEYKVDSTRGGLKRIFSAAFVASKKLYILNIAHSDKPESPLDMNRRKILEQVLHSFDAAPST